MLADQGPGTDAPLLGKDLFHQAQGRYLLLNTMRENVS